MSVTDLFFKRQKRLRGEFPDVYQYSTLPEEFRIQVIHILSDLFGDPERQHLSNSEGVFEAAHQAVARELGRLQLVSGAHGPRNAVFNFIRREENTEYVLSMIELLFAVAPAAHNEWDFQNYAKAKLNPKGAVEEFNIRCQEHGVGFQMEGKKLVRLDSHLLHQETVRPVLTLLSAKRFAGAEAEFRSAHEHYRHQRYGESLNECLKALESTLKVICDGRRWAYSPKDTAKQLLDIVFQQGLVPEYLAGKFAGLRSVLAEGIPTTRNKESGHGAGAAPKEIPAHLTSYILHLTAASILFLAEADKAGR